MRCTQPQGFSDGGKQFLKQFVLEVREKGIRIFPDGTEEPFDIMNLNYSTLQVEPSGDSSGMFEDNTLYQYTALDGRVFIEYVQHCTWSSGPMEFYALKDEDGKPIKETLWTEVEIAEIIGGDEMEEEKNNE